MHRTFTWMGSEVMVDLGGVREMRMNMTKVHCLKFSNN